MQHTRQLLQHTFMEVAHEKGLAATTVKEITERADLNPMGESACCTRAASMGLRISFIV
jgi:hypothetical protein